MAKTDDEQLRTIRERCVLDPDVFETWLAARGWAWQPLARGEYPLTVDQAVLLCVCQDPVMWCRAFMTEPDTGTPYNFWPYQEESVRHWYQKAVHQDGAEVGKTREIVAIILWGMCTGFGFTIRNPSMLIGAPQQTHLDEIIMAIEAHVGESEGSEGRKPLINTFWRKPKKHPHYLMRFKSPTCTKDQLSLVYFRPAGHDGEAFRGVHVNAGGMFDEAAKVKNKVVWSEYFRSFKPGAFQRLYSVPDGDNTSRYYALAQKAIPDLPDDQDGWRLFHWPKTLMPEPFWSADRDRELQRLFGGKDTPGYQRNVLGLHGQQDNPVWKWELLMDNVRDVHEYRIVRLLADDRAGTLSATLSRCVLAVVHGKKSGTEHIISEQDEPLEEYRGPGVRDAMRRLLRGLLEPMDRAVLHAGADLGFSKDPTEILICRELGHELRDICRISMNGVGYDIQAELIYCLDELYGFQAGWGVDFGNAGTAVVQILQNQMHYIDADYTTRLTGYQFKQNVPCIDEDGDQVMEIDPRTGNESPRELNAKEWSTELITKRLQARSYGLPFDNDVIDHMSNHTAREGSHNRIFDKKNDHTIDARRVLMLRKTLDNANCEVDIFSTGIYRRTA